MRKSDLPAFVPRAAAIPSIEMSSSATAFIHSTAPFVTILAYLGKFLRVVDAEDVIDRHVDDHHQHELVTVLAGGCKILLQS